MLAGGCGLPVPLMSVPKSRVRPEWHTHRMSAVVPPPSQTSFFAFEAHRYTAGKTCTNYIWTSVTNKTTHIHACENPSSFLMGVTACGYWGLNNTPTAEPGTTLVVSSRSILEKEVSSSKWSVALQILQPQKAAFFNLLADLYQCF